MTAFSSSDPVTIHCDSVTLISTTNNDGDN